MRHRHRHYLHQHCSIGIISTLGLTSELESARWRDGGLTAKERRGGIPLAIVNVDAAGAARVWLGGMQQMGHNDARGVRG
jgi:hypothetical protein